MEERVVFSAERRGYSKTQVDQYIDRLSKAYNVAYEENRELQLKYNDLQDNFKILDSKIKSTQGSEVITRAIVDAEILAQKIISDAHAEAETIRVDAKRSIEDAKIIAETLARELKDEAYLEKAKASIEAQKIIEAAKNEASIISIKAQEDIDEAQEVIDQTLFRVRSMLGTKQSEIAYISA